MTSVDGRRRQWVPISAWFPLDKTGTALQKAFGPSALAVWVAYLAACKRNHIQGRISYGSEVEAWSLLGILDPDRLGFTLKQFFDVTGRLKKTKRTARGRVTDVVCTVWEQWNDVKPREHGQTQKATSGQGIADTKPPDTDTYQDHYPDHDNDPYPDRLAGRGLRFAITEASKDPEVRNAKAAGEFRYKADPSKYNAMADKDAAFIRMKTCDRCDSNGWTYETPDGRPATRETMDAKSIKCAHQEAA
ncbi:MAG TPA: hypothetical protein VM848_04255 [Acidimicrobiia bacterium]|nr:hypothetical protein [Acidimicrobiia bacterium]